MDWPPERIVSGQGLCGGHVRKRRAVCGLGEGGSPRKGDRSRKVVGSRPGLGIAREQTRSRNRKAPRNSRIPQFRDRVCSLRLAHGVPVQYSPGHEGVVGFFSGSSWAGLLTAAVGEWQFSVFLRDDLANFLGSLAFNTLYLSGVYLVTRLWLALGGAPEKSRRWMILRTPG